MLLTLSLIVAVAFAEDPMAAAKAEVEAYPGDYGAWANLARLAQDSDPALAAEAWAQAEALSGGNLESAAGQVMPRVATGDLAGARAAAARAVAIAPEDPHVWLLQAEALRHPDGLGGSSLAAVRADHAARQAYKLAPEDPWSLCGMGWSRLRLGDQVGASAYFTQAGAEPCAAKGLNSLSLAPRLRGAAWTSLLLYPDLVGGGAGLGLVGHGGVRLRDRYDLAATARATVISQTGTQAELWLSSAYIVGGHGGRLVVAGLKAPSETLPGRIGGPPVRVPSRSNGAVLGAQAWATRWATLKLDANASLFGDGRGWQSGARLSLPLFDPLSLELGGGLSAFEELAAPGQAAETWAGEGPAAWGSAALSWQRGDWAGDLHGRLGEMYRPVYLDIDTTWNLSVPTAGALGASVSWVSPKGPTWTLGYDSLSLQDPDTDGISWLHVLTVGVNTVKEPAP